MWSPRANLGASSLGDVESLPDHILAMLPGDTASTWEVLAPLMPDSAYLVGGTGLTVHLQHRVSRDLDFYLDELWRAFQRAGKVVASRRDDGTINCLFNGTKVQVLDASTQRLISPTIQVAGMRVASVEDLMATKIKVILDRGEMRDYFDLLRIEQKVGLQAEVGIVLAIQKYEPPDKEAFVFSVLTALGGFDDVADDPDLPLGREEIESYWVTRQLEVAQRLNSFGGG
jgi:hypothetical protein